VTAGPAPTGGDDGTNIGQAYKPEGLAADEVLVMRGVEREGRYPDFGQDELQRWVEDARSAQWPLTTSDGKTFLTPFFLGLEGAMISRPPWAAGVTAPWCEVSLPWAGLRSSGPSPSHAVNSLLDLFDQRRGSDPRYRAFTDRWAAHNGSAQTALEVAANEARQAEVARTSRAIAAPLEAISPDELDCRTGTLLVDFWAAWCVPCRALTQTLIDITGAWREHLRIVRIDVEQHPDVIERFGVAGLPTLMLFLEDQTPPIKIHEHDHVGINEALRHHVNVPHTVAPKRGS
jgi:thiol-disulfide isomerase/thioredoxin